MLWVLPIQILNPFGDSNGHAGTATGVYSIAHGRHNFGTHNAGDERVLEFTIANRLYICSTWVKKKNSFTHIQFWQSFNPARIHIFLQESNLCCQQYESHPQGGVHPTAPPGSVWLHANTPCARKSKFSPRICTWKQRKPAITSQFQSIYHGLKLTDQVMKVLEWKLDF